jgi:hypothetical protein
MQISSAAKTERIVGIGHRENECRNAEGRAHHIKHKPERDAAERDQAPTRPWQIDREIK